MITSGIALGLAALWLLFNLCKGGFLIAERGQLDVLGNARPGFSSPIAHIMEATLRFIHYSIVFAAALSMKHLRNWGFSLAGSILALVPSSLCIIATLPFGIWSIVVLCRKDLKNAFR